MATPIPPEQSFAWEPVYAQPFLAIFGGKVIAAATVIARTREATNPLLRVATWEAERGQSEMVLTPVGYAEWSYTWRLLKERND